ncbi:MAG: hypothetical protein ACTS22_09780 [Phycisphaerales bacterium]
MIDPRTPPRTDDALHRLLREALGLTMPRPEPSTPGPGAVGVGAPFAYLCHAFFEDRTPRDAVVWANRGGGKTFLGAVATALDLVFKPGIEIRIIAGSLEQAGRMHQHLRGLFESEWLAPLVEGRATEKRLRLTNGSRVELLAASQAAIRGTRVQKLRCDEVDLFHPAIWEAAQLVTRSTRCGPGRVRGAIECLSTMHRPFGMMADLIAEANAGTRALFKWGVVDVLDRCGDEHACHDDQNRPCPLWDECGGRAKRLPPGQEGHIAVDDAITMKRRVSLPVWEAEMLCKRPRRTDAVYPGFDRAHHVTDEDPAGDGLTWIAGMDFGFRAPTVVLFACVDRSGVLRIMDERVEREVLLADHARAITRSGWPEPVWIGVDPAGHQRSGQTGESDIAVLRAAGLTVRTRPSSVRHGIGLVTRRLTPASGPPTLLVHRRCTRLIDALERYHYPEHQPESTEPVKDGPDHAADALRYLVTNLDDPFRASQSRYA